MLWRRLLFPFLSTYSDTLSEEERTFSYELLDEFISRHGDEIKSRALLSSAVPHCPECGEVQEKEEAPKPEKPMFDTDALKITVLIALMMLACPPLGIALIRTLTKWSKGAKIFLSIIYILVFFIGFILLVPRWAATIALIVIPSFLLLVFLWKKEPGCHIILKITTSVVSGLIILFGIIGIFYYG